MTHHKMTNSITNKLIENSHKDGYFQKEIQDCKTIHIYGCWASLFSIDLLTHA